MGGMDKRKTARRPAAPKAAHLPARGTGCREETTRTGAPDLMAAGGKMACTARGYTVRLQPTSIHQGGAHETRRNPAIPRSADDSGAGAENGDRGHAAGLPDTRNANTRAISDRANLRTDAPASSRADRANTEGTCWAEYRSTTRWRRSSALSSGSRIGRLRLRRGRAAQIRPIHIGAQIFTAHSARGGALDGWAALSWDAVSSVPPKANRLGRNTKRPGHGRRAANPLNCFFNAAHAAQFYTCRNLSQQVSLSETLQVFNLQKWE